MSSSEASRESVADKGVRCKLPRVERPAWDDYYMDIARAVAARGN